MNLQEVQSAAIACIRSVATFIQEEAGKISNTDVETKSLNSLVTYVDKTAETLLVNGLSAIMPASVFLTEENTIEQGSGNYRWIIDPLDGTTNFIHQVPVYAISVALEKDGVIVIGIVYELNRNELFTAIKGGGAFLNNNMIQVKSNHLLANALIATGFPYYDFQQLDNYIRTLRFLMEHTRGIRRLGSAAVDLCYTACGRFDAFFEYSLSPWDVAAGGLILQEAGGEVKDFSGGDNWLFGKEIAGGNANLLNDILNIINNSHS